MDDDVKLWRIRVDLRCAIDLPSKNGPDDFDNLPSTFVECGWTIYEGTPPDNRSIIVSKIINDDRNPMFNEQFLVAPPQSIHHKDGYLYVALQDKNVYSENISFYIPLQTMNSFVPYHFVAEKLTKGNLYWRR